MPVNSRKRKREENENAEDEAPIPAALIRSKKKAKKGKSKSKSQATRKGKKRKGDEETNPQKKSKKETPSKTQIQSNGPKVGKDSMDFVDPAIFKKTENQTSTKTSKVTPISSIPPSSVPQRVGFDVTPKSTRSPIKRRVTPFPRKQNLNTPISQEDTRRGTFRRLTKEDIERESEGLADDNEDKAESKSKKWFSNVDWKRIKSACATCALVLVVLLVCAIIFPMFLIDNPLSTSRALLKTRLETWLVNELAKDKGMSECHGAPSYGMSKHDAIEGAMKKFRFDEEMIRDALDEVLIDKTNAVNFNGRILTTSADSIKTKECKKKDKFIENMRKESINILRIMEGEKQCENERFEVNNVEDKLTFTQARVRRELFKKFDFMTQHYFDELFELMVSRLNNFSDELRIDESMDLYTTNAPSYTYVCQFEFWLAKNKFLIAGICVFIFGCAYLWYKTRKTSRIGAEAKKVFAEVVEQLENKSRTVSTWVPISHLKDLVHENGDLEVWAEVEKMVAKSKQINKGVEMVDGMEQKCWKVKLHHS